MNFHTILTHEHPDLDAMLCCYLLKKYGEENYPDIAKAKIAFCPAGRLPGDKTPSELEEEGILPVDIGGGRLDTHPDGNEIEESKKTLSAANLVAKDLKVDKKESLLHLLEFSRIHDSEGRSLTSKNPIDHLVAIPNIIRGASFYYDEKYDGDLDLIFRELTKFFFQVFEAIEFAESSSEENFLTSKNSPSISLFSVANNCLYLSEKPSLICLLAAFFYTRFSEKGKVSLSFSPPPAKAHISHNIEELLIQLGIFQSPELNKIITLVENLKPSAYLLDSRKPLDESVSLVNIAQGFFHQYDSDPQKAVEATFRLFDFVVAYENDWQMAINEYQEKRQLHQAGKIKIAAITAKRGVVVKVARWQDKVDLTIFRDEKKEHISICLNRTGRLRNFRLGHLVARIRMAEMFFNKEIEMPEIDDLYKIGELSGWFLHQSERLLLHGSPKASREPSSIPFDEIVELTVSEIDRTRKLTDTFCPPKTCTYGKCLFFPLRLSNCFEHRKRIQEEEQPFKEGDTKNKGAYLND